MRAKYIFFVLILLGAINLEAQAQLAGNALLSLNKDPNGLFILDMSDAQGIKGFRLEFQNDKPPYGGDLGGCPLSRVVNNIVFYDPSDFKPPIKAIISNCQGGETKFEISAPKNGVAQVKKLGEEPKAMPPAPPTPASPKATQGTAPATEPLKELMYPIPELGGCGSESACKAYCDKPDNLDKCIAFGKAHGLVTEKEAARGEKFSEIIKTGGGPGGCKTENECESYCNDVGKINECIKFAEDHNFLGERELAEAKKIKAVLDAGKKLPGGCKNKKACEAYCQSPEHIDECFAFAKDSGFMSETELKEAEKFIPLMKAGKTPGGCKTKETCEAFCGDENNFDKCVAFAEEAGFLSDKERDIIRKTGGKGPGGCRGRACQTFCQNLANQDACLAFAKENGLISDADLKRAEEGMKFMQESLKGADPKVKECVEKIIGAPGISGQGPGKNLSFGGPEIGDKIRECMESLLPKEARGKFKFEGQGFSGPGGCKSREECEAYCKNDPKACGFEVPQGGPGENSGSSFNVCVPKGARAEYVCGINGKHARPGVETTYFNKCHAEQQGVQILHAGVCIRHGQPDKPCSDIADPVCGNDNNTWISACYAKEQGGGVKYEGVCKGQLGSGPGGCKTKDECEVYCKAHPSECSRGGGGGGGFGGPGGCKNQEECTAYCQVHPQECGGGTPPPPPAQGCVPTPSGLVSRWNGDAVLGTTVPDLGNGNNGTILGGVTATVPVKPVKVGKAFNFDGSSGYINMGNPANLNFGAGPFSLEAWFNWDGRGSSVDNIIRKSNYGPGAGAGYWIRIGRDAKTIEFSVGATTGPEGQTLITAPISPEVWHYVVATRDSSDAVKLYVDGLPTGAFLRQASKAESTSESSFTLGAWADQHSEFFSGLIDEVSVYNRALSASEVKAIFNAGSAGKCSAQSQSPTQTPPPSSQIPQDYCSSFVSVPSCSYVGTPDSQNYKYCKQCFPNK